MPSPRLAAILLSLILPSLAQAKAWQGIDPGRSTAADAVARLGEPVGRVKRGAQTILLYKGDRAVAGTREAQVRCREDGVVEEITVFLASPLDAESIEGTYGRPRTRTFTDTFQKVWLYPQVGVTVYFDRDGGVEAIAFAAPSAPPPRAAPAPGESTPAPTTAPPQRPERAPATP